MVPRAIAADICRDIFSAAKNRYRGSRYLAPGWIFPSGGRFSISLANPWANIASGPGFAGRISTQRRAQVPMRFPNIKTSVTIAWQATDSGADLTLSPRLRASRGAIDEVGGRKTQISIDRGTDEVCRSL